MAAYLNRTLSMVSGNYDALTDVNTRTLHHGNNDVSPLQIFVKAKKKINDIFGEIEDYVTETTVFIDGE
jgi:mitofusin 2